MQDATTNWRSYEEVATYLLNKYSREFGLARVEGKQKIPGRRSATDWEIDAKGVRQSDSAVILIEVRRHTTSRLNQESLGAFCYRIIDTGAAGGIIVSPNPLQVGAKLVAESESVIAVQLNGACSTSEFVLRFLSQVCVGVGCDALNVSAAVVGGSLETVSENRSTVKAKDA